jgi:hypothetical protein
MSFSFELWHRSFAFVDSSNLAYTDACLKLAASTAVSLFHDGIRIAARADDVADARCSDLIGYPLPGRSVFFTLTIREDLYGDHDR